MRRTGDGDTVLALLTVPAVLGLVIGLTDGDGLLTCIALAGLLCLVWHAGPPDRVA